MGAIGGSFVLAQLVRALRASVFGLAGVLAGRNDLSLVMAQSNQDESAPVQLARDDPALARRVLICWSFLADASSVLASHHLVAGVNVRHPMVPILQYRLLGRSMAQELLFSHADSPMNFCAFHVPIHGHLDLACA